MVCNQLEKSNSVARLLATPNVPSDKFQELAGQALLSLNALLLPGWFSR